MGKPRHCAGCGQVTFNQRDENSHLCAPRAAEGPKVELINGRSPRDYAMPRTVIDELRAEVERLKAEHMRTIRRFEEATRLSVAERDALKAERDEWKAADEHHYMCWVRDLKERDDLRQQLAEERKHHGWTQTGASIEAAEADKGRSQVAELRQQLADARDDYETMRKESLERGAEVDSLTRELAEAKAELGDMRESSRNGVAQIVALRSRIEALADEWGNVRSEYHGASPHLRALLQPPKAETALDVLARIEQHAGAVFEEYDDMVKSDLAKLRALLEKEGAK